MNPSSEASGELIFWKEKRRRGGGGEGRKGGVLFFEQILRDSVLWEGGGKKGEKGVLRISLPSTKLPRREGKGREGPRAPGIYAVNPAREGKRGESERAGNFSSS